MSEQNQNNDETRAHLVDAEHVVTRKVRSIWEGFVQFALRDSVIEVALGLMYVLLFLLLHSVLLTGALYARSNRARLAESRRPSRKW